MVGISAGTPVPEPSLENLRQQNAVSGIDVVSMPVLKW